MAEKAKLPMGIENFERIHKEGFYYVDKTVLIREFLENPAYVNLFTPEMIWKNPEHKYAKVLL